MWGGGGFLIQWLLGKLSEDSFRKSFQAKSASGCQSSKSPDQSYHCKEVRFIQLAENQNKRKKRMLNLQHVSHPLPPFPALLHLSLSLLCLRAVEHLIPGCIPSPTSQIFQLVDSRLRSISASRVK